jgi:hypothetical protein
MRWKVWFIAYVSGAACVIATAATGLTPATAVLGGISLGTGALGIYLDWRQS